eukprot:TRINITY_DN20070_c0_g1_i1.p1 TRINITY_DN20070_c0_g1~~TRINITY_DN20070_c0_g1_i1.p1  ORF type:complete len:320 (+),score=80.14 TRINITY_DN20070_c0_g1_i1:106-1065(+)
MNFFNKTAQFLGEGVGVFEKTEEPAEFKTAEEFYHVTKESTQKLIHELQPASTKGSSWFKKENDIVTTEMKQGATFVELSEKLKRAAPNGNSPYADGLKSLGESLLEIGNAHAAHDKNLMDNSIGKLQQFNDSVIKELEAKEKDYDSKRLDFDASRRVYKKKPLPENETKKQQKKALYEEAKDAYRNEIDQLQDSERHQVEQLQHYCSDQAKYFQQIAAMYAAAGTKLGSIHSQSASFQPQRTSAQSSSQPPAQRRPPQMRQTNARTCTALYDFAAQNPQELSLRAGDVVTITKDVNADWWAGSLNGRSGLFPKNYVRL